ncbi:hypothetical protein [Escherichia coli]|uniref:hypothetical protein n=1 Tax=Escherichia coli TaxID=562 RepID=UPI00241100A0|nr:hypothetical protein [Escherichia coli]EKS1307783.1 hypothetical protein [Escherichia coli]
MTEQTMTNRELVDAAIELAGDFYSMMGYELHRWFYESHKREKADRTVKDGKG